jgi:hypothetical protein
MVTDAQEGSAIDPLGHGLDTSDRTKGAAVMRDRDLFVFCFNGEDGKFTAHEALVGQNARAIRDKTGQPVGEQMYRDAKEGLVNTVSFIGPLAGSTEQVSKRAYVTRIGDQVCGVSFYRFNGLGRQPTD